MLRGGWGGVKPVMPTVCSGFSVKREVPGRPVVGSSSETSTMPVSSVKRVVTVPGGSAAAAVACTTSVMSTVPRTPATAFGVLTLICSPGFMRSLATASAIFPEATSRVAVSPVSVIVRLECSRTVTTALPPSRMRASD